MEYLFAAFLLFATALVPVIVGAYSLRFREFPAAVPFSIALFASAIWATTYGLDMMSESLVSKIFWLRMRLTVIHFVPLFALLMAAEHALRTAWITRVRLALLFGPAVINIPVVWTKLFFTLYVSDVSINHAAIIPVIQWTYSWWGVVMLVYSTLVGLAGLVFFLVLLVSSKGVFFRQTLFLASGLAIPFLANLFFSIGGITPIPGYNIAPNLLLLTGLLSGWALYRYQFLSISPLARNVVVEEMGDAVLIIDEENRLVDFNHSAREVFSIWGEHLTAPASTFIPMWMGIRDRLQRVNTLRDEISLEIKGNRADFEISVSHVHGERRRNIGYVISLREITRRKKIEEQLRQLSKAVEQNPASVVIIDLDGNIEYANPMFTKLTGYSQEEVLGKNMSLVETGQTRPRVYEEMWKTVKAGQTWEGTFHNRRKSGELYWEHSIVAPVFDENSNISNYIAINEDISEREQTRHNLERRIKELETIYKISTAAAALLDLHSLVSLVGQQIEHVLNIDSVFIAIHDPKTNLIDSHYWTINGQRVSAEPLTYGQGLTTYVLKSREYLLIDKDFPNVAPKMGVVMDFVQTHGYPKTWLGVPIISSGEALGMISVQDYQHEHAFTEETIRLLQTIAADVGIAIQNVRLYEETQRELELKKSAEADASRRAEQMSVLNAVGRAITSGLELEKVLTTLRIRCQQIAPQMDIFSVALYDERTFSFKFLQFYDRGILRTNKPRDIRKKEGGVTAEVITTRKTIYLPDLRDPETMRVHSIVHTGKKHARSYLGIPLLIGDRIIGVLSGQSYQPDAFPPDQVELLETVGLQAAVALQNASLYEETRRRMEEMESLYGISTALSQNLDLESVMKNLLENCRQVLPIDAFYVALYDEESHMVSHPLFWDKGKFVTTAVRDIRLTPGLSGEVILSRKTLQLPDVLNPDTREKYQIIHLGGKPTRCYVGVPMITHDRIIGVISMQTYEPDSYTSEQIRLLEMIAHQAAVAIENSRLYRHAQEELALRRVTQRSLEKEKETLQVQLTQVEALQDELREQAIHDPLTGLYNRRYLDEMLNGLLNYARIYDKPICVIMMDIDHFKKFNDTHSHLAGDQLLQSLADLLRSHTRPTDITCRYGGEEFILVLPDTNLEIAGRRAEELRKAFEVMVINFQGKNLQATISMGIASFPEHGNTVEELTMQADQALYAAKTAGRNRVVIWRK